MHSPYPVRPSAETERRRNSFLVVRANDVSNGKRKGRHSSRTSTRSIFIAVLSRERVLAHPQLEGEERPELVAPILAPLEMIVVDPAHDVRSQAAGDPPAIREQEVLDHRAQLPPEPRSQRHPEPLLAA